MLPIQSVHLRLSCLVPQDDALIDKAIGGSANSMLRPVTEQPVQSAATELVFGSRQHGEDISV